MRLLIVGLSMLFPLNVAAADNPPQCKAATEGVQFCMAEKACVCRFYAAGNGRPARYAWDCGVLRPSCDLPPADLARAARSGEEVEKPPVIVDARKAPREKPRH